MEQTRYNTTMGGLVVFSIFGVITYGLISGIARDGCNGDVMSRREHINTITELNHSYNSERDSLEELYKTKIDSLNKIIAKKDSLENLAK